MKDRSLRIGGFLSHFPAIVEMERRSHRQGLLKLPGFSELSLPTNQGKYTHPSFLEENECISDSQRY